MKPRKYQAIIFDLDDTLFDTWGSCVGPASQEAFSAMIQAGLKATIEDCFAERQRFFSQKPKGDFFAHLVQAFGVVEGANSNSVREIGDQAFHQRDVESGIKVFPGAMGLLADLSSRYSVFLVTAGHPETQKQKVQYLKVAHFFTQIFYVDPKKGETKRDAFLKILTTTGLKPLQVLCVGNRLDIEIAEAKALGIETCYLKYGELAHVLPDSPDQHPDYQIHRISDIIRVCHL